MHFRLRIVSEAFEGLSLVGRQRLVYQSLAEEMGEGGPIHALSVQVRRHSAIPGHFRCCSGGGSEQGRPRVSSVAALPRRRSSLVPPFLYSSSFFSIISCSAPSIFSRTTSSLVFEIRTKQNTLHVHHGTAKRA